MKKNKIDKKQSLKIKRTVQETLPYIGIDDSEGVIQLTDTTFSKTYKLKDTNYQISQDEEQQIMFLAYADLLNYFDSSAKFQVTINNRPLNEDETANKILLPLNGDKNDIYRKDYNKILKRKLSEGKNNIHQDKYLTVTINEESMDRAIFKFIKIDAEIGALVRKIGKSSATAINTTDRLDLFYGFFNQYDEDGLQKSKKDVLSNSKVDFEAMRKQGITSKDLIAPESMRFENEYFKMGEKFAQVLFLQNTGSTLSDTFVSNLNGAGLTMMCTLSYDVIDKEKAVRIVKNQITNITSQVIDRQKKASKSGYTAYISPEMEHAENEARELLQDIIARGQNMFLLTMTLVHTADTLEELKENSETLIKLGKVAGCNIKKLTYQQEVGLTSTLPLGFNKLQIKRTLTSESAAVFMPFNAVELLEKGGNYYGLNTISHNLILLDRLNLQNQNGFILGTPGSGKSFAAKMEMISTILNKPNAKVRIIDPEGEFAVLANALGGKVIKITPSGKNHINLFDLDAKYSDNDNPLTMKTDFILSIVATCLGQGYDLSPTHKAIVERCVRQTYAELLTTYDAKTGRYNESKMPTLRTFYQTLMNQPEYEARDIALALEIYACGSFDTFSHQTNVGSLDDNFIVYDIRDVGANIKSLALQIILDNVWMSMIRNKQKGLTTYLYIDEAHLLFANNASAKYLQEIFKRARKWGGVPTCISQNVSDILENQYASTIFSNCDFVQMLNQSPTDKMILAQMFNISDRQLNFITNASQGEGLIHTSKCLIPFVNKIPEHSKLYKLMTTKPTETHELYETKNKK